ncbi:hypothetical protein [Nesterenkonia suensis]
MLINNRRSDERPQEPDSQVGVNRLVVILAVMVIMGLTIWANIDWVP